MKNKGKDRGKRCMMTDTHTIRNWHSALFCGTNMLLILLRVTQRRKVARFPFRMASMFLGWKWKPEQLGRVELDQEELRCFGRFVMEEDVLDWNVNDYFLDGLNHL